MQEIYKAKRHEHDQLPFLNGDDTPDLNSC